MLKKYKAIKEKEPGYMLTVKEIDKINNYYVNKIDFSLPVTKKTVEENEKISEEYEELAILFPIILEE